MWASPTRGSFPSSAAVRPQASMLADQEWLKWVDSGPCCAQDVHHFLTARAIARAPAKLPQRTIVDFGRRGAGLSLHHGRSPIPR